VGEDASYLVNLLLEKQDVGEQSFVSN
jgi:hypothetical protein